MHLRALIPSLVISIFAGANERDRRRLVDLRETWGQEISRPRNMDAISLYHTSVAAGRSTVDDRTWQDLGMDDLFARIDRNAGTPGQQMLYHQMRTYEADDRILAERARQQAVLKDDPVLREKCQVLLSRLGASGGEWLGSMLLNPFPANPRFAPLLYLCSFLGAACILGIAFIHLLFLPALAMMFINIAITANYGRQIRPYFTGFSQIVTMLGVSEELAAIPNPHALPQLDTLRRSRPLAARLRNRLGWLVMDRTRLSDLSQLAVDYINMFFLFDIVVYLRSNTALRQHKDELVGLWEAVGSLDASIAVASYLQGVPGLIRPTLGADRGLEVKGICHPLLATPVGNSLNLDGRSALIAGPNMAGKTAFIRTVGINVILAQTLNLCVAEKAVLPRAVVRSAIRREDNLEAGQSYFFAEIQQILEFIRTEEAGPCCLFLIDEIFRGTNTVERVAASTAVLHHLGQRQLVLATTHDVELQQLLADTFDMYHFSDQVVDGRYRFDYHIHPGPAQSRNAIKLLEISGYPASIVREAETLAARNSARS
jgi:hypothetical protein